MYAIRSYYAIINHYKIGYCSGSLKEILSAEQIEQLKFFGILNEKGDEVFKGYITIPLTNELTDVVGFYGRAIDNRSTIPHKYLKGDHKGLLNAKAVKIYSDELILTESVLDGISLKKLGIDNIIPCYGVNGFSDYHNEVLKNNLVKKVIIAFDNDDAGITGSEKLKEKLLNQGYQVKEIFPPNSKDWNEYLLNGGSYNFV